MASTKTKCVRFAEIPQPTGPRSEIFRRAYERSIAALKELKKMREDFAEAEKHLTKWPDWTLDEFLKWAKDTNDFDEDDKTLLENIKWKPVNWNGLRTEEFDAWLKESGLEERWIRCELKNRYSQYLFKINELLPTTENSNPTSSSSPSNQQPSVSVSSSIQNSRMNSRRKKRSFSSSKHFEETSRQSALSTTSTIELTPCFNLPRDEYYYYRVPYFQCASMGYIPNFIFPSDPQSSPSVHTLSSTSSSAFGIVYTSSYSPLLYTPNWVEHNINHFCSVPVTDSNTSVCFTTPKRQHKRHHQNQQQHQHQQQQQQRLSSQRQHNKLRSHSSVYVTHNPRRFHPSNSMSFNSNRISPSSNHSMAFHNFVYQK